MVEMPVEIDIANADQVREDLLRVLNTEPAVLVIDMSATRFCAAAGINALHRAYRRANATGTELRAVVTAPLVHRVLVITGTHHLIGMYPSLAAACAIPAHSRLDRQRFTRMGRCSAGRLLPLR
jgi:anti-anti-sigma factor